jgi:hypothetical protein
VDRWGRVGGFVPEGNAGAVGHMQQEQLQPQALGRSSSQNTIWRPASSSVSCLHAGHSCDLCSKVRPLRR